MASEAIVAFDARRRVGASVLMGFLLWLVALGTNTHIDLDDDLTVKAARDSTIYLAIANAAPKLPAPETDAVYHGAQRFFLPYSAGLVAKAIGVSSAEIFAWVSAILVLGSTVIFALILADFLPPLAQLVFTAVFAWNPYSARLQMALPGFLNDGLFVLGLMVLCSALLWRHRTQVIVGIAIMISGKQSALFAFPVVCSWLLFNAEWRAYGWQRNLRTCFLGGVVMVSIYAIQSILAAKFSSPSVNMNMTTGMIQWIRYDFSISVAIDFLGRIAITYSLPIAIGFSLRTIFKWNIPASAAWWIALALAIVAQPFMSGPIINEGSTQRLVGLALGPTLITLATMWRGENSSDITFRDAFLMIIAIFVGSLHHLFSIFGPDPLRRTWFLVFEAFSFLMMLLALHQSSQFGLKNESLSGQKLKPPRTVEH